MQGLNITSIALTWAPYLTIGACDELGYDCQQNFGALIDMANIIGKMINASVISTKDANDDWGVYPHSGNHDYTGEWGGVMGRVKGLMSIYEKQIFNKLCHNVGGSWRVCNES